MPASRDFTAAASAERPLLVGIDVGGTSIKLGLVDSRGETLAYQAIPTHAETGAADAADRMGQAVRALYAEAGVAASDVARAGLATPGPLDIATGMLLHPGNLPHWHNTPIRDLVSNACGLPVRFANDANAAAYGEFWRGAGREVRSMVMFTLGTGVGGGIVIDDVLLEGCHGCGGELGHIIIDCHDDAPNNSLDILGTLEGYCGSYGVTGRAEAALARGDASSLRKRTGDGEELTPLMIAEEAEAGDQLALDVVLDTAKYLAIGIVTAVHTIDPESVVIGGAMTFGGAGHPLGERFLDRIRSEAKSRMFEALRDKVSIDFATLGSDAGYLGAAGLARRDAP
ncbi:MAG: ROK family protein [Planctomycetales bacterium]|nr:ROK family protein [Planctomycetales bacterium]